jgi:transposase
VGHPGGLTDEQWSLIEPLLPNRAPQRGGRWVDHRVIIDAVAWRQRTGRPWRELPCRFGPWQTAYHRYTVWGRDGTWSRIRERLQVCSTAEGDLLWLTELSPADPGAAEVDSADLGAADLDTADPNAADLNTADLGAVASRMSAAHSGIRSNVSTATRPARARPRIRPPAGSTPPEA